MEINKLSLKAFYESHKDSYWAKRRSGDIGQWDEAYKWEILPRLNGELSRYESLTSENASEIVKILQKNNPNAGSFCHWTDFDNLQKLIESKPTAAKALTYIWNTSPDEIGSEINSVNGLLHDFFSGEFKLSPAAYGYMLAAQDCDKFAIYRDTLIGDLVELNMTEKPKDQGEKYQLLNDSARYIGELMKADYTESDGGETFTALDGQDFLYVTIQYPKER